MRDMEGIINMCYLYNECYCTKSLYIVVTIIIIVTIYNNNNYHIVCYNY